MVSVSGAMVSVSGHDMVRVRCIVSVSGTW